MSDIGRTTGVARKARELHDQLERRGRCSTCLWFSFGPAGDWCRVYDEPVYVEAKGDCEGWEDERG